MRSFIPSLLALVRSLSARLLVLTILFVMLAEVLIFVPSVARFRLTYMQDKLAGASLVLLALEASPSDQVNQTMAETLLDRLGAYAVAPTGVMGVDTPIWQRELKRAVPTPVERRIDLDQASVVVLIYDALRCLMRQDQLAIEVQGTAPGSAEKPIMVTIPQEPMRLAMIDYGRRILWLSLVISLIAASLIFLSLQWLLVRPMRRMNANMVSFRADPEDGSRVIRPSLRRDEIGQAERELSNLQETVRLALRQKARLAALGTAVSKINHDLRNILATARLVSDQLAGNPSPDVRRAASSVLGAIDRAVTLCASTLAFTRGEGEPLHPTRFSLEGLLAEVVTGLPVSLDSPLKTEIYALPLEIEADHDQLYRALLNLARNAMEAGATRIVFRVARDGEMIAFEVEDNGHGLAPRALENLFTPFAGSARKGGTGLGLPICREVARAHGGDMALVHTGAEGTLLRLSLPAAHLRPSPVKPIGS